MTSVAEARSFSFFRYKRAASDVRLCGHQPSKAGRLCLLQCAENGNVGLFEDTSLQADNLGKVYERVAERWDD